MTTASAESELLTLKRLKTYLRATTKPSQSLHTHIDYTDNLLNITDIAQEFVACNERRQSFIGSY